jgi:hypothetical protein
MIGMGVFVFTSLLISHGRWEKEGRGKGENMNTQTEPIITNPMQAIEASPLEEQSLPADTVFAEQQSEYADLSNTAPVFVP